MENLFKKFENTEEWLSDVYSEDVVGNFYKVFAGEVLPAVINSVILSNDFKKYSFGAKPKYVLKLENTEFYIGQKKVVFKKTDPNSGTLFIPNTGIYNALRDYLADYFEDELGFVVQADSVHIFAPLWRLLEVFYHNDERRWGDGEIVDKEFEPNLRKINAYCEDLATDFYYQEFLSGYVYDTLDEAIENTDFTNLSEAPEFKFDCNIIGGYGVALEVLDDPYSIVVNPLYVDMVREKIMQFMKDYDLGNSFSKDGSKIAFDCSFMDLVNAYYMELQRLEYYREVGTPKVAIKK